jgi:predicted phage baseplate assembly protein
MNETCGCCEGAEPLTPISTANRPGLDALVYRVGTHATFLETMRGRLSSSDFPSLANLKTRDANDPAIAFLDAWATVADVLTFYQERIANEGYLRTATERRSILELARLVGYALRPGVAATVYPAFTMETGYNKGSEIPAGTRIQSIPGPGEMPQFFETSEKIDARADWNNLQPRLTRPQFVTLANATKIDTFYLQGISTNLKPNDPLLLVFNDRKDRQVFRQVQALEPQAIENRTRVKLHLVPGFNKENKNPATGSSPPGADSIPGGQEGTSDNKEICTIEKLDSVVDSLLKPPSIPPANALRLALTPKDIYKCESDVAPQLLATLKPVLENTLHQAWANTEVTQPSKLQSTQTLRVTATPFGANAPRQPIFGQDGIEGYQEWPIISTVTRSVSLSFEPPPPIIRLSGDILTEGAMDLVTSEFFCEALISIKRGSQTQSKSMIIKNLVRRDVKVEGLPVTYSLISGTGDTLQPSRFNLVFKFQEDDNLSQATEFSVSSSPGERDNNEVSIVVSIKHNTTPLLQEQIGVGERLQYSIKEHTLKVDRKQARFLSLLMSDETSSSVPQEQRNVLALNAKYEQIMPESWVVINRTDSDEPSIYKVQKTETLSKAAYGISAEVTQLTLDRAWLKDEDRSLETLRQTTIYAQSEELKLAEEAIDPKEEPVKGNEIELNDLYDGLQPGRWLIVSGERVDIGEKTTGVKASELVMLSGVTQRVAKVKNSEENLPGDKTHTFLQLAKPLEYEYKRDTITIYGNVVKASHGETRSEVLGSGDGSKAFQQFALRQPPLTYLAAPTPAGAASTLAVRVNDILWHEADSLAGLKPSDRLYITKTDDDKTTVIFGNGQNGLRLPTGIENIKAVYRSGIGKVGNVNAEQINLLTTRPLGLKGVTNPLPATGGADKESRDQGRRNAPLAVMALDRLVSVQDYADFARTFAGIGKASATVLSDGRRQLVYVTITGTDNIPIDKSSDLYRNLFQAFQKLGDPNQAIQVEMSELMLLLLVASTHILPDYQWESVEPRIRQRLLDTFSFERRELGQAVFLSEVISTIQQVPGIAYVDVDILDTVSETEATDPAKLVAKIQALTQNEVSPSGIQPSATSADEPQNEKQPKNRIPVSLARVGPDPNKRFLPAQLAVLSPRVPLSLILNPVEVKP